MTATVTPLPLPGAAEAVLRRRVAELELDVAELTDMWCRANREGERQRLMLVALNRLAADTLVDRLAVLMIGVLLGLALSDFW